MPGRKPLVDAETIDLGELRAAMAEAAQTKRDSVDSSVSPKTLRQYASRCGVLERLAAKLGLPAVSEEVFFAHAKAYRQRAKRGSRATLEGYRSACAHWELSGRWDSDWASKAAVTKACKGERYRAGAAKQGKVGAITENMLLELVDWVKSKEPRGEQMAEVLSASLFAVTRITGLLGLKPEYVRPGEISVPNKGYRAATMDRVAPRVWQKVLHPPTMKMLAARAKRTAPGSLLFPVAEWRLAALRAAVKRAARELGWPRELDFRVHSLRHGGIQWLLGRGVDVEDLPVMGSRVRTRYAEDNSSRLKRRRSE